MPPFIWARPYLGFQLCPFKASLGTAGLFRSPCRELGPHADHTVTGVTVSRAGAQGWQPRGGLSSFPKAQYLYRRLSF